MAGPIWLGYGLAVAMVAVSAYCAGRLVVVKRWKRHSSYDVNIAHVLMGLAMAGMLVPRWNVVPDRIWMVAFGFVAFWFLALSGRFVLKHGLGGGGDGHAHLISHDLTHMAMACTMLYMYRLGVPVGSPGGTMTMGSAATTQPSYMVLSLVLVMILLASAIWQLEAMGRLSPPRLAVTAGVAPTRQGGAGGGEGGAPGTPRDLTSPNRTLPGAQQPRWLAPRLEMACHVCMCIAMGYMLVLML